MVRLNALDGALEGLDDRMLVTPEGSVEGEPDGAPGAEPVELCLDVGPPSASGGAGRGSVSSQVVANSPRSSPAAAPRRRHLVSIPVSDESPGGLREQLRESQERLKRAEMFASMLLPTFERSLRWRGGALDARMRKTHIAMARASASSTFFTSRPFSAALSKRHFQLLFFAVSIWHWYSTAIAGKGLSINNTVEASMFRFTPVEIRNRTYVTETPLPSVEFIKDFGVLLDGCSHSHYPGMLNRVENSNSYTLSFPHPRQVNGWSLTTSSTGPTVFDPVEFTLEASNDEGRSWQIIGASTWRFSTEGAFVPLVGVIDMPLARDFEVYFDNRLPYSWILPCFVSVLVDAMGLSLMSLLAMSGRVKYCKAIFIVTAFSVAVLHFASAAVTVMLEEVVMQVLAGFSAAILPASLMYKERWFIVTLLASGLFALVTAGVGMVMIWALRGDDDISVTPPLVVGMIIDGVTQVALSVSVFIMRHRAIKSSAELVLPDQREYDAVWEDLVEKDHDGSFAALKGCVDAIRPGGRYTQWITHDAVKSMPMNMEAGRAGAFKDAALQLTRSPTLATLSRQLTQRGSEEFEGPTSARTPIHSLDQLYAGAEALSPLLREKVQQWALVSRGLFSAPLAASRKRSSVAAFHAWRSPSRRGSPAPAGGAGPYVPSPADVATTPHSGVPRLSSSGTENSGDADSHGAEKALVLHSVSPSLVFCATPPAGSFSDEPGMGRGRDLVGVAKGCDGGGDCEGYVRWEEALSNERLMRRIKWAGLKKPDRSIEKAVRSYGGDVSRLTDIARQMIVFDNVKDLTRCLGAIAKDSDVAVERVKNRYDPEYDPKVSGGYRDVALNVRLLSREACELQISDHVCEVQLLLKSFAQRKSDEGHARYVQLRNVRGE